MWRNKTPVDKKAEVRKVQEFKVATMGAWISLVMDKGGGIAQSSSQGHVNCCLLHFAWVITACANSHHADCLHVCLMLTWNSMCMHAY